MWNLKYTIFFRNTAIFIFFFVFRMQDTRENSAKLIQLP